SIAPDVGETLSIQSSANGAKGTTSIVAGKVRYTPNANAFGADSFTYVLLDSRGGTATATVSITINEVNDAPTAVNDSATTNEDTVVPVAALVRSSIAPDVGETLSIQSSANGAKGTTSIVAGKVRYTPNANAFGADS